MHYCQDTVPGYLSFERETGKCSGWKGLGGNWKFGETVEEGGKGVMEEGEIGNTKFEIRKSGKRAARREKYAPLFVRNKTANRRPREKMTKRKSA